MAEGGGKQSVGGISVKIVVDASEVKSAIAALPKKTSVKVEIERGASFAAVRKQLGEMPVNLKVEANAASVRTLRSSVQQIVGRQGGIKVPVVAAFTNRDGATIRRKITEAIGTPKITLVFDWKWGDKGPPPGGAPGGGPTAPRGGVTPGPGIASGGTLTASEAVLHAEVGDSPAAAQKRNRVRLTAAERRANLEEEHDRLMERLFNSTSKKVQARARKRLESVRSTLGITEPITVPEARFGTGLPYGRHAKTRIGERLVGGGGPLQTYQRGRGATGEEPAEIGYRGVRGGARSGSITRMVTELDKSFDEAKKLAARFEVQSRQKLSPSAQLTKISGAGILGPKVEAAVKAYEGGDPVEARRLAREAFDEERARGLKGEIPVSRKGKAGVLKAKDVSRILSTKGSDYLENLEGDVRQGLSGKKGSGPAAGVGVVATGKNLEALIYGLRLRALRDISGAISNELELNAPKDKVGNWRLGVQPPTKQVTVRTAAPVGAEGEAAMAARGRTRQPAAEPLQYVVPPSRLPAAEPMKYVVPATAQRAAVPARGTFEAVRHHAYSPQEIDIQRRMSNAEISARNQSTVERSEAPWWESPKQQLQFVVPATRRRAAVRQPQQAPPAPEVPINVAAGAHRTEVGYSEPGVINAPPRTAEPAPTQIHDVFDTAKTAEPVSIDAERQRREPSALAQAAEEVVPAHAGGGGASEPPGQAGDAGGIGGEGKTVPVRVMNWPAALQKGLVAAEGTVSAKQIADSLHLALQTPEGQSAIGEQETPKPGTKKATRTKQASKTKAAPRVALRGSLRSQLQGLAPVLGQERTEELLNQAQAPQGIDTAIANVQEQLAAARQGLPIRSPSVTVAQKFAGGSRGRITARFQEANQLLGQAKQIKGEETDVRTVLTAQQESLTKLNEKKAQGGKLSKDELALQKALPGEIAKSAKRADELSPSFEDVVRSLRASPSSRRKSSSGT